MSRQAYQGRKGRGRNTKALFSRTRKLLDNSVDCHFCLLWLSSAVVVPLPMSGNNLYFHKNLIMQLETTKPTSKSQKINRAKTIFSFY